MLYFHALSDNPYHLFFYNTVNTQNCVLNVYLNGTAKKNAWCLSDLPTLPSITHVKSGQVEYTCTDALETRGPDSSNNTRDIQERREEFSADLRAKALRSFGKL